MPALTLALPHVGSYDPAILRAMELDLVENLQHTRRLVCVEIIMRCLCALAHKVRHCAGAGPCRVRPK